MMPGRSSRDHATREPSRSGGQALPPAWLEWLVCSLLDGCSEEQAADALVTGLGLRPDVARQRVHRMRAHPAFMVARAERDARRKLESHLDALEAMRLLDRAATEVPRRRGVTPHQFFEHYYATNRPVLIEDFASGWPALRRWTPDWLRDHFGDLSVEVMGTRDHDRRYEQNFERHRQRLRFADYVDEVMTAGPSNDRYLVANNRLLASDGFRALLEDVDLGEGIVSADDRDGSFFWFGPEGTVTPLHHDVGNVLFVQVMGEKRFLLVSPYQSHRVDNRVSVYSEVDAAVPDPVAHPQFVGVSRTEVVVTPGQALFIPVGWWHHVTALTTSISLSFTSFTQPNQFVWHFPDDRRVEDMS